MESNPNHSGGNETRKREAVCSVFTNDQRILDDYSQFRKVRHEVHICPAQWAKMTKRTKSALVRMILLAEKAVKEGKL